MYAIKRELSAIHDVSLCLNVSHWPMALPCSLHLHETCATKIHCTIVDSSTNCLVKIAQIVHFVLSPVNLAYARTAQRNSRIRNYNIVVSHRHRHQIARQTIPINTYGALFPPLDRCLYSVLPLHLQSTTRLCTSGATIWRVAHFQKTRLSTDLGSANSRSFNTLRYYC